ncbi:MAG: hypothetical protein AAGL89_13540 [Pseudomonadota bacterium]
MAEDRIVLCMKWGQRYPSAYVNILFRAVQDNLSGAFRFICLTDDPTGLAPGIEAMDLPRGGIPESYWKDRGIWGKLALFQEDLHGLSGRALFLDLDMLIVGPLDRFFDFDPDKPFVSAGGGKGWRRGSSNPNPTLTTTVFAFDIGSQPQILQAFLKDPETAKHQYVLEQAFVEATVTSWAAFPDPWVVSFKRHLRQPVGLDLFLQPNAPGPEAICVSFHGNPDPSQLVSNASGYWGEFPHYGRGPVPWVRDNWLKYGYVDPA